MGHATSFDAKLTKISLVGVTGRRIGAILEKEGWPDSTPCWRAIPSGKPHHPPPSAEESGAHALDDAHADVFRFASVPRQKSAIGMNATLKLVAVSPWCSR